MHFSTLSILTLTLTTSVLAANRGYCVNDEKNGDIIPDIDAGKSACGAYANNAPPEVCTDCGWVDDPAVQGDEHCLSDKGEMKADPWTKICQLFKASRGIVGEA